MNPNQALWGKSDFTRIAAAMRESSEALVKAIGVESRSELAATFLRVSASVA